MGVLAGSAASWRLAADRIASAGDSSRRSNVYGTPAAAAISRGGRSHPGGLLVAGVFHLAVGEPGQVAVDEHVVGVDDVQSAGAGPEEVRAPDERPPGGLGVVEADDQGDGLGGPGGPGSREAPARARRQAASVQDQPARLAARRARSAPGRGAAGP